MDLQKAIEILSHSAYGGTITHNGDFKDAQKLGIEALKARKAWQDEEGFDPAEALRGEDPPPTTP